MARVAAAAAREAATAVAETAAVMAEAEKAEVGTVSARGVARAVAVRVGLRVRVHAPSR